MLTVTFGIWFVLYYCLDHLHLIILKTIYLHDCLFQWPPTLQAYYLPLNANSVY